MTIKKYYKMKNLFRYFLLLASLLPLAVRGQRVQNVSAEQVGSTIHVHYHLDQRASIRLYALFSDGSELYCSSVSGDVGDNVSPGNREIVWNVLADMEGLRDPELRFRVEVMPSLRRQKAQQRKENSSSYYNQMKPIMGFEAFGGWTGVGGAFSWGYGSRSHILGSFVSANYSFPNKMTTDSVSSVTLLIGPTFMFTRRWMVFAGIGVDVNVSGNENSLSSGAEPRRGLGFAYGLGMAWRVGSTSYLSLHVNMRPELPHFVLRGEDMNVPIPTFVGIGYGIDF